MIVLEQYFNTAWYNVGNIQVPSGMTLKEKLGDNPNGSEWDLGNAECVHLNPNLLPENEREKYLNALGKCWHAFANVAHNFELYWGDYELAVGKYKLEFTYYGDYVGVGTDKPPITDPQHAQCTLFANDIECIEYMERNTEHTQTLLFEVGVQGYFDLGFNVYVQWPQGSDSWGNGCFIKSFVLTKIEEETYTVKVIKTPQEEYSDAPVWEYAKEHKRTITGSTDDCIRLMTNPLANERSTVQVVEPYTVSQQEAIQKFEELGIKWEVLHG